ITGGFAGFSSVSSFMPLRKFLMPEARSPATRGSLPAPKMIRITSRTISQCQKLNVPIPLSPPTRGLPADGAPAPAAVHYDRDSAGKAIYLPLTAPEKQSRSPGLGKNAGLRRRAAADRPAGGPPA